MRSLLHTVSFLLAGSIGGISAAPRREAASPEKQPSPSIAVVIFRLSSGADSTQMDLELVKFVDPLSNPLARVDVDLPADFTATARAKVAAESSSSSSPPTTGSLALFLHATPEVPAWTPGNPLSIASLNGSYATVVSSPLDNGNLLQGASFDANLGAAAVFLTYFILPDPAAAAAARKKLIEAELQRCVDNTKAEVIERKIISAADDESILEIKAKSPRNPKLTIHCRLICSGKQLLALTAVATDSGEGSPNTDHRAMFDAFRFH